jgi:hypothetical protein
VAYPLLQGKVVNFAAFHARHELENTPYDGPWISSADKEEFLVTTSQWEPEVQSLLSVGETVPFFEFATFFDTYLSKKTSFSVPTNSANGLSIPSSHCPLTFRDESL